MRFKNVAPCSHAESVLHYLGRKLLTQKKYFGVGCQLADSSSGFDSIKFGKTDVEQNQVRLQFFCFVNRLQSV